jgi:hypothetical protein
MLYKINVFFFSTGFVLWSLMNFSQSINLTQGPVHKFYVSTANIEFNSSTNSLEIVQRIFTDDLENVLRARYGAQIKLAGVNESEENTELIKRYVLNQWTIKNNDQDLVLNYLGHQYDIDQVKIFIEVPLNGTLAELFFENKTLFDLTSDQQNILHVKVGDERKSLLLFSENPNGVLNFN